jgi:hypothetical protein
MESFKTFLDDLKTDINKLNNSVNEYKDKQPLQITADDGFDFKQFVDYTTELKIPIDTQTSKDDHITSGDRLGMIDRLTKTLKNNLMKFVYSNTNFKIGVTMKKIVSSYNNAPHKSLHNKSPNETFNSRDLKYEIMKEQESFNNVIDEKITYLKEGEKVRIYESKGIFDKEKPNFSKEIYYIHELKGNKYKVKKEDGTILRRLFKPHEVLKVTKITNEQIDNSGQQIEKKKKQMNTTKKLLKENVKQSDVIKKKRERKKKKLDDDEAGEEEIDKILMPINKSKKTIKK